MSRVICAWSRTPRSGRSSAATSPPAPTTARRGSHRTRLSNGGRSAAWMCAVAPTPSYPPMRTPDAAPFLPGPARCNVAGLIDAGLPQRRGLEPANEADSAHPARTRLHVRFRRPATDQRQCQQQRATPPPVSSAAVRAADRQTAAAASKSVSIRNHHGLCRGHDDGGGRIGGRPGTSTQALQGILHHDGAPPGLHLVDLSSPRLVGHPLRREDGPEGKRGGAQDE